MVQEPIVNPDVAYALQQRPLQTTWASGLLIMGGGFFMVPITATLVFGVIWSLAPDSLSLLFVVTAAGIAQLGIGLGAWRGMAWPRWVALSVVAAELVGLVLGNGFLALGLLFVSTATILLWRPAALRWSGSVMQARR